ncbi:hypothetical protein ATO6_08345 [Oceanicola sp. 22II-s10i]|uniref:hypothetical protein n=1 Tax=Oceanicola sp. 22II-s10i TaxID=1317116 RepID=UPI000B525A9D|nr:hypothetical protein [Oceanicola sp. 22II-s10i]OWU85056.1 hypothetical protein ATO6_08345 [Oceanicola sp. 22II-s10i]
MTALSEYQRLEARGLWRERADAQRRDVVVSLGDATLVLSDTGDRAVAHWSLAAVIRLNPGETPALYSPDGLDDETLELDRDSPEMEAAIERIRRSIDNSRPKPGRLRFGLLGGMTLGALLLGVFWLPGALERHARGVIPDVKRTAIGEALLAEVQTVTGPPCTEAEGLSALTRLAERLSGPNGPPRLYVMRDGVRGAAHLPGRIILLNKAVVEDTTDPDVVAGYIIAEQVRASQSDPMGPLLEHAGLMATVRLLTTGTVPDAALESYAKSFLTRPPQAVSDPDLLARFATNGVRSTPYAYARDITGETTIGLIEADPVKGQEITPVLRDADWLRLQAICGG